MNKKKLIGVGILSAFVISGALFAYFSKTTDNKDIEVKNVVEENQPAEVKQVLPAKMVKSLEPQKTHKAKLHNFDDNHYIPFSAMVEISELPEDIRELVKNSIKESEVYSLKLLGDKIFIIKSANTEEEKFSRHDFEIVKISMKDKKVERDLRFPQKMSNTESEKEIWNYEVIEEDMMVPTSHVSLSESGKTKLKENWYYNREDGLKYKVVNDKNKTLSLRKTSAPDENGNWSDEHIFYDEDGNTLLNVSSTYEKNRLARFTFYEAENPNDGIIIVNEYNNGDKTKETVYTPDYKVKNVYNASYENGERKEVTVLDNNNKEIEHFSVD